MPRSLACLLLLLVIAVPSSARTTPGPLTPSDDRLVVLDDIEELVLPALDVMALEEEDRRVAAGKGQQLPHRIGGAIQVHADTTGSGHWEELEEGGLLWRWRVHSPGATDLSFGFRRFEVGSGTTLHVVSGLDGSFQGPYGRRDAAADGQLWTAVVPGDRATLELRVPPGEPQPEIELMQVSHGYRDLFDLFSTPSVQQGDCHNDVVCPLGDGWRDTIQAVGVYTLRGIWTCTGTMITDVPLTYRNWFLTADHCGVTSGNAPSMVVYWNYQSESCGDLSGGSLSQNQSGATLRATWERTDFTLVELSRDPDELFNVYYAGWDATDDIPPGTACIHHPATDEKAINFDYEVPRKTVGCVVPTPNTHWTVRWNTGVSEPGSSGSGLFHSETQRLIGDLTGGASSCSLPGATDCYGRFGISWEGGGTPATRLRDWLDPDDTGTLVTDGSYVGQGLEVVSLRVVDSCAGGGPGDGNGILEPGETVDAYLSIEASGDLTGVSGVLSSTSSDVTILTDTAPWGTLPAGVPTENVLPLRFRVGDDACFTDLPFELAVSAAGLGTFVLPFEQTLGVRADPDVPLGLVDAGVTRTGITFGEGRAENLIVEVEIEHEWVGDLRITLQNPAGTEVVLLDRPGVPASEFGCGDENMLVFFTDAVTTDLEDRCEGGNPWYIGSAQPVEPLEALEGEAAGT
ncbi:MAG: proprotein convertase P-domain-containing protein, partial [Acidobacteriota bacterium]